MIRRSSMKNMVCLADGCTMPTNQSETGINENRLIVGTTRCGKTFSIVEPMLLHTYEGSLVVNITKRALFDKYAPIFEARGYEVLDLNFAEPEKSKISYDPLNYLKKDRDFINIGRAICEVINNDSDPFWMESAANCTTAMLKLVDLNSKSENKAPSFSDFKLLFSNIEFDYSKMSSTNLNVFFDEAERLYPNNLAWQKWKTIRTAAPKTTASISSILNATLNDFFDNDLLNMMSKDYKLSFENLASKKTVLFVTTSPFNRSSEKLVNLFYNDLFRNLFDFAERCPNKELPIPVNIICDDFAVGSKIPNFAEDISIFCAKRIAVTMLLQSESQLEGMYSKAEAQTIINNCDTYVYMGGMDDMTCHSISRRINKPVEDIFYMPLEQVIVMRRGSKPVISKRYQTLEDPLYKKLCMKAGA